MSNVERIALVLDEHAGCQVNAGQDNSGSGSTGVDVWSCGIRVPFVEKLEDMERLHLATAIAGRLHTDQSDPMALCGEHDMHPSDCAGLDHDAAEEPA